MIDESDAVPRNRFERRKLRTRAALIGAAQSFIAADQLSVPILDITRAADVGMGSFYNHFATKDELFSAAISEVLDQYAALLDMLTVSIEDPAEAFAVRFRLAGRLFRRRPIESRILLRSGLPVLSNGDGLAARAFRDIVAACEAGRFTVRGDPAAALAVAGGALMGLGQLLHDDPNRDDARTSDDVTFDVLRLFGITVEEAQRLCSTPPPDLGDALDEARRSATAI